MKKFGIVTATIIAILFLGFYAMFNIGYDFPEGVSKTEHSLEDVQNYVSEYFDSNEVIVDSNYIDGVNEYDRAYRMWNASYNGIDFVITSQEEMYFGGYMHEFAKTRFTLRNNYNYHMIVGLFSSLSDEYSNFDIMNEENEYLHIYNYTYFSSTHVILNENDFQSAYNEANELYDEIIELYPEARFYIKLPVNGSDVYLGSIEEDYEPFSDEAYNKAVELFNRYIGDN
ncbi:MAG TPA: hypothetical protein PLH82_02520 [Candidatus Paceibacterota bacterium]|jgi:hypothetical protein|nr:hypothetical protein [Candidatus Paceibacterota bacterium]HOQ78717.1 hypothetical protein [Candidatus Absconditabacterales bacterium]